MVRKMSKSLTLTLVILLISILSTSCTLPLYLDVTNNTNDTLSIFAQGDFCFQIAAGQTITTRTSIPVLYNRYFVEATTPDNQTIYSQMFDKSELDSKNGLTLTVLIPSGIANPFLNLEIDNQSSYRLQFEISGIPIGYLDSHTSFTKRVLDPSLNQYPIEAIYYDKNLNPKTVFNKTISQTALSSSGYIITISDSDLQK
jgi:hypothetical protein